MQTFVLTFQCADQKGIVARISDFIFRSEGNIVTADQFSTDPEGGHFFLRIEFYIDEKKYSYESITHAFSKVACDFNASWQLHSKDIPLKMGILVSKPDHCLVDLLYLWRSGELAVDIPFVISNHEDHEPIVTQYGVPFHYIPATSQEKKEAEILEVAHDADFLVLARYMQILRGEFISSFNKDIINIHHSFLPSFAGAHPYKQAFDKGVKVIGATAHFVSEELDQGPIISQIVESVSHRDTVESLLRTGKNLEKRALSYALHKYIDFRVFRFQNKTIVF